MSMLKELTKSFAVSTVVTLGMITAVGIWGAGFGDKVEGITRKVFKVKES